MLLQLIASWASSRMACEAGLQAHIGGHCHFNGAGPWAISSQQGPASPVHRPSPPSAQICVIFARGSVLSTIQGTYQDLIELALWACDGRSQEPELEVKVLGWPKNSSGFFHNILQKNPNEIFDQPNILDPVPTGSEMLQNSRFQPGEHPQRGAVCSKK